MKAVILAGGKGTRLRPYTTNFPKPLMPIGDKPILEIVIDQLRDYGIKDIIIATGHLEELIRAFFQDGKKFGVNITYSKEDTTLGTAGPLNLMRKKLDETFLLMNGDVLSDLDFSKLILYHKRNNNIATIATSKRTVNIDFGVIEINKDKSFDKWKEKPLIEYLVSMGIYIFEPDALNYLPKSGFFNLPEFIMKLHKDKRKVSVYIHDSYWLDIGRPEDYEEACKRLGDKP